MSTYPLSGVTVIEAGSGIAAGYCGKLFVDAGAQAIKLEPPSGDPLRHTKRGPYPSTAALFSFLAGGKQSVVVDVDATDDARRWLDHAHVVIADGPEVWPGIGAAEFQRDRPRSIVVTITPFGLEGPWAGRAANEFTLQGWCGSIGGRGDPNREPVAAGGRLGEWASGLTAAVAALGVLYGVADGLAGDLIDVSMLEVMTTIFNGMHLIAAQIDRRGPAPNPITRNIDVPSVQRTADGWVGFATNATEQFRAFSELCGHPEWPADPDLGRADRRQLNRAKIHPQIEAALATRHTDEVMREAETRRIPVAPVGNGQLTPGFEQLGERDVFVNQPGGSFKRPRPPYLLSKGALREPSPAPNLGSAGWLNVPGPATKATRQVGLPLEGLRVFDLTGYWAGPYAGQILGFLGADVIKVESVQRPDGTRMGTSYATGGDRPWELAPLFHGNNTGKRAVTLDLTSDEGQALGRRLLDQCDLLIENFSPRVVERFGLLPNAWTTNPELVAVRIPAFGLTGPWRERAGFAQNMEQTTGLAWVTGYPDDCPVVPKGPCDPIGGLHAVFAALVGLFHRRATLEGQMVEAPLVESALNVAAQQVIDWTSEGYLWSREANRGPLGAPQGVYRCAGDEQWIALSVETDDQWRTVCDTLGLEPTHATEAERWAALDELDAKLAAVFATRDRDESVAALWSRDVPVAAVEWPRAMTANEQMLARGFYVTLDHPVAGPLLYPGFPARFANRTEPLHTTAPPTLGQHSREILSELLGLDATQLDELEATAIIGTKPLAL